MDHGPDAGLRRRPRRRAGAPPRPRSPRIDRRYTSPTPVAGSSNGRTLGSGPSSLGSNPSPAASPKAPPVLGFCLLDRQRSADAHQAGEPEDRGVAEADAAV